MRILVIEDEAPILQQICTRMRSEGYVVDEATDGEVGLYAGREFPVDAAIVDLGLPKRSGMDVIRAWRADDLRFPVLVLTARGRWEEKVEGLEAGADDYLVKPFFIEELLARVRALVRRSAGWAEPVLKCGPIALDTRARQLRVAGANVELTAYEYKILEYLMLHAGVVVSKTELTEHIYEDENERDSNVLEVLVGRLRRKLDPQRTLNPIETLRGRGYVFRVDTV